jgi:hypothetical protein
MTAEAYDRNSIDSVLSRLEQKVDYLGGNIEDIKSFMLKYDQKLNALEQAEAGHKESVKTVYKVITTLAAVFAAVAAFLGLKK